MRDAEENANHIRRKFGFTSKARFPIQETCVWYGMDIPVDADPLQRYLDAVKLGMHRKVDDAEKFAQDLMVPLWLLESICCHTRIPTGEKWFFGLFEKTRGMTTVELAICFDVPVWLVQQQLERLI